MSVEKELVRRYFQEVLDQGRVELIEELFHPQCVMHRPKIEVSCGGPLSSMVLHAATDFVRLRASRVAIEKSFVIDCLAR